MTDWSLDHIHPHLLKTITEELKFESPTNVQAEFFKYINKRCDFLVASKTGSGKTLCFLLTILNKIFNQLDKGDKEYLENDLIDALIILPSRELAIQVFKEFKRFLTGQYKGIKISLIIGGFSKEKQLRVLNKQSKIVIATPGRLWDMIEQDKAEKLYYLGGIQYLVLDEIDRIIELGQFKELKKVFNFLFKQTIAKQVSEELPKNLGQEDEFIEHDGKKIKILDEFQIENIPVLSEEEKVVIANRIKSRRCFLVSATLTKLSGTSRMMTNKGFSAKIKKLRRHKKLNNDSDINPKMLDIMQKIVLNHPLKIVDLSNNEELLPQGLKIQKIKCNTDERIHFLYYFLKTREELTIVFVNSINAANKLNNILRNLNIQSVSINSKMRQGQRIKKLESFKKGNKRVLVTTDLASRGIDIEDVSLVIHYHLPKDFDTFVHRCGRTARAGKTGLSIIISDADDHKRFVKYLRDIGQGNFENITVKPFELKKNEDLVLEAIKLEKEDFTITKNEKDNNWIRKAAKELELDDVDGLINYEDNRVELDRKRKNLRHNKKMHKQKLNASNNKLKKRHSSFLAPCDVQAINEKIKRFKQK